jgi:hypothetical protein
MEARSPEERRDRSQSMNEHKDEITHEVYGNGAKSASAFRLGLVSRFRSGFRGIFRGIAAGGFLVARQGGSGSLAGATPATLFGYWRAGLAAVGERAFAGAGVMRPRAGLQHLHSRGRLVIAVSLGALLDRRSGPCGYMD